LNLLFTSSATPNIKKPASVNGKRDFKNIRM
jgi:hypothetical protein